MRFRRFTLALALLLAMCCAAGAAQALTFPDLECFLNTPCNLYQERYQFSEDFLCDAYVWEYPKNWDTANDAAFALLAQWSDGWEWEKGTVEGYDAYMLTSYTGEQAIIVSGFQGHVLLLVPVGCEIEALLLAKDAQPEPVVPAGPAAQDSPAATSQAAYVPDDSGGTWEWVEVEVDCPFCVGGRCDLCNGTGTYRLYGQAVPCDKYCVACDGEGTYTETRYVQTGY